MAQQQSNITISAPGFFGLNTEDAPIDLDQRFALQADNAVIDLFGRLGARKGFASVISSPPDATGKVKALGRVVDGTTTRYIAGVETSTGNELWELTNVASTITATELTLPVGYTLETAKVQILSFAQKGVIIVPGAEMLILSSGTLEVASDQSGWLPPQDDGGTIHATLDPTCGCSAYGRLWISGVAGNNETIWYSDLLDPAQWYDGKATPTDAQNTAGLINVSENWPNGIDRIMGITAHNNLLVVFGRQSMLIWGNPSGDPAAIGGIFLQDTIDGLGLVDRDAVTSTGSDLLFVDDTGLRSLARSIQEQSAPLGDLTKNVRSDIIGEIRRALANEGVDLVYSPRDSFVLVIMRGSNDVWVADTRGELPNGGFRITRWPSAPIETGLFVEEVDRLFLGCSQNEPMCAYERQTDFGEQFSFSYSSPVLSFGDAVREKIVKQIDYTIVSGLAESTAFGGWEYVGSRPIEKERDFPLAGGNANYYAEPESSDNPTLYDSATYGDGETVIRRYRVNATGSGENVIISFKSTINGSICSLQQINVQALIGRIN